MKSKITIPKRNFLTFLICCLFALTINAQTAPAVVSTAPSHNATNVIVDNSITITFDQPIQTGINGKDLTIWYADSETVYDSYTTNDLTISGNTLTLNITLPYNTDFYISIESGLVKNTSDQHNATYGFASGWLFSTENDTHNPIIQAMSPSDGSVGVWEGTNLLSYTFNENVQAGTGNILVKRVDDDSTTLSIDIANPSNISVSGSTLTVISTTGLDYSTEYYVEFPSGVIEDLVGNPFVGIGVGFADQDFTIRDNPDNTAPLVSSFSPADGAINVSTSSDLVINFNEDVQIGSGSIFVKLSSNGSIVQSVNVSSATISGRSATISLPSDLTSNTSYFVTMVSGVFEDLAGNDFAGFTNATTWNFTTINTDNTPPSANVYSPANNSTGASISNNLTLTFSEPIQLTTNAVLKNYDTNTVIPSTSSVSGSTLTVNPTSNLDNNTHYYVTLVNGGIQDLAGNNFIGFSTNVTWNFTTVAAADVTSPIVQTFSPLDNATEIAINANLVMTFDENIQATNGAQFQIRNGNGTLKENFVLPNANVTVSGNTVTINPTSDLANSSDYYITTSFAFVTDLAANNFAGISDITTWNFTTVAAADVTSPTVQTFSPLDNATEIAINANLVITFDENIQATNGAQFQIRNGNGTLKENFVLPNANVTVSGNTVTINPTSDLANSSDYYILTSFSLVTDLAGNNFAGIVNTDTWNFTTAAAADVTPPTVVTFTPLDNATGVNISNNLTLAFDETIQLTGGAVLKNFSGTVIPSSSSVSGSVLTINPTSDLANNTQFYVEIANGVIKDIAGNSYVGFSGNATWNFTTVAAADITAPVAQTFTPTDNATDVSVTTNLTLLFDEAIQLTGNAVLKNIGGSIIPSTSTVSGSTLTVNPTSDLANNTQFYVEIANGVIKDIAGNSYAGFSGNTAWNFTTEDGFVLVSSLPANNAIDITIDSPIVLTFNEPIQLVGTGSLGMFDADTDVQLGVNFFFPNLITVSGNTATINYPTGFISLGQSVYFVMIGATITNASGDQWSGFLAGDYTLHFENTPADTTPPAAVTFTPADNATDVDITTNLTLLFDEAIQLTGNAVLKNIGGAIIPSINTVSGSTLTINPTSDLANNTQFYVEIANGVIKDIAGNSYAGFSGNTTWNFTTEAVADTTPPAAVTFTPADNATDVNITTNLTLLFDEAIQLTGNAVLKNIGGATIPSTSTVSGSTLTINPTSDLANNTQFYVEIANGVIKDIAGNNYAGFSGNTTWNFTTETAVDVTAPTLSSLSPADTTTDVLLSADLVLTADEEIVRPASGNIIIKSGTTTIKIIPFNDASVDFTGSVMTITGALSTLNSNTAYWVYTAGIKDLAGNILPETNGASWRFTTGNTLGTEDIELSKQLSVFPNPTSGLLKINLSNDSPEFNAELFDVIGKRVFSNSFHQSTNQLNIDFLQSGVYILKITTDKATTSRRIIKM